MNYVSELPLKLARKCVVAFGYAIFDEDTSLHNLNTGVDEETAAIVSGKEFSLVKTTTGKVVLFFFFLVIYQTMFFQW